MSSAYLSWPQTPGIGLIELARSLGVLSPLDQQFSQRLSSLYDETTSSIRWALAIACRQEAAGHVCADLHRLAAEGLVTENAGETAIYSAIAANHSVEEWIEEISACRVV